MVMIPALAIVQARMGSTRFPGKMMAPLMGRPLIWWAWRRSIEAFGEANVVVAIPGTDENNVIREFIEGHDGQVFFYYGAEDDVLGRLYHCAHTYRWHPESVICRVTADDPLKDPALMRGVAWGARYPVELSCEATTLQMLTLLHYHKEDPDDREHLTRILSPVTPPPAPPGIWSVDLPEHLAAIEARMKEAAK